jgi:AcrR family transcriptional regulator
MEGKKIDRRARKTKKLLDEALLSLMSTKKINEITVTELTELADLNRSTFYLYYKDVYDMVDHLEAEILEEYHTCFLQMKEGNENTNFMPASYSENMLSFYSTIFDYIKSNEKLGRIILASDSKYSFLEKLKTIIMQAEPPFDVESKDKLHYLRPFIISGCIGVMQQWIQDDLSFDAKELSRLTTEIIAGCITTLD